MHPFKTLQRSHGNASRLAVILAWGVMGLGLLNAQTKDIQVIELAKRKAMVEEATELVKQGDKALEEQKAAEAVEAYAGARELLPDVPALKEMRQQVTERYAVAALTQAAALANRGDLVGANKMVDAVLDRGMAPEDPAALRMKRMLNNPVRVNPALTPEHHDNVQEVLRLIEMANSG